MSFWMAGGDVHACWRSFLDEREFVKACPERCECNEAFGRDGRSEYLMVLFRVRRLG